MARLYKSQWFADKAYHLALLGLLGLSILGCLAFFRYHLIQTTAQFAKDFERQNLDELQSSNVFALTTRLSALSRSLNYTCIKAQHKEVPFFSKTKGAICKANFLLEKRAIVQSSTNPDIKVEFILRLPPQLEWAALVFSGVQLILMALVIWGARGIEKIKHAATEKIATLASQVAHDIRSPLEALLSLSSVTDRLPEKDRVLFKKAIRTIQDIANNLIEYRRSLSSGSKKVAHVRIDSKMNLPPMQKSVQHLGGLVYSIISEKRVQFANRQGISIELTDPQSAYKVFSLVDPTEFKRVVSNIINNAVEAINGHGQVELSLSLEGRWAFLTVTDTGKGIPKDILPRLMQKNATFGKKGGSGLGLYHAREVLQALGGEISISSEQNAGTQITIKLPRAESPQWFTPEIVLKRGWPAVILDDDDLIHGVWDKRFETLKSHDYQVQGHYFKSYLPLKRWIDSNQASSEALFLIDYEFIGESQNGLDIINKLKINSQSILVTANFEQEKIRQGCLDSGVKLLPKEFVYSIPIVVKEKLKKFSGLH